METIKLEINKKIYDKVIWLLQQFKPEDLRIVEQEGNEFETKKKYLQSQLKQIDSGKAKFISTEELDSQLEKTIKKYENHNS